MEINFALPNSVSRLKLSGAIVRSPALELSLLNRFSGLHRYNRKGKIGPGPEFVMPALQAKTPIRQSQIIGTGDRQLEQKISRCHAQAKDAAERGDVAASARFILEALDAERRLAGRGPQVLQLIKPRH